MGLWKEFALWTLIIGPILVSAYIMAFIPVTHWPIGNNFPENESLAFYFIPLIVMVQIPGAILGSFLFLAKEVASG